MSFTIDEDLIAEGPDDPFNRTGETKEYALLPLQAYLVGIKPQKLPDNYPPVKFRLLDDDDEVYYIGTLHDDPECLNQSAARDYGEADAGAVKIQVERGGKWVYEIG